MSSAERLSRRALESFCENQPFPSPCKFSILNRSKFCLKPEPRTDRQKSFTTLGIFSVSGGDPDCSPTLKWAAEVIHSAPADSPYVFLYLNLTVRSRTSCSRDWSAKLPYPFNAVQSLLN